MAKIRFDYFFLPFAQATDMDDTSVTSHTGTVNYYGYCMAGEIWLIQSIDTVTGAIRFIAGSGPGTYVPAWTNRKSLTYDYIFNVLG